MTCLGAPGQLLRGVLDRLPPAGDAHAPAAHLCLRLRGAVAYMRACRKRAGEADAKLKAALADRQAAITDKASLERQLKQQVS